MRHVNVDTIPEAIHAAGELATPIGKATDDQIIHAFLYHSGEHRSYFSEAKHDKLMAMCDGYGEMTAAQLRTKGIQWDWSHVRDSSDGARRRVSMQIRRWLAVDALDRETFELENQIELLKMKRDGLRRARSSFARGRGLENVNAIRHHLINTLPREAD